MNNEKQTFTLKQDSGSGKHAFSLKQNFDDVVTDDNYVGMSDYSIRERSIQALNVQNAALQKSKKKAGAFKKIKVIFTGIFLLVIILGTVFFVMKHLPDAATDSSYRTTAEILQEAPLTIGNADSSFSGSSVIYTFSADMTVSRKNGNKTEKGTYEVNDSNVLIMSFPDETLSYLIEYDSDGNMVWVHSHNGFEEIIYPEAVN